MIVHYGILITAIYTYIYYMYVIKNSYIYIGIDDSTLRHSVPSASAFKVLCTGNLCY